MTRQRVRIRFRKEGDLRFISHRDLLRLFERLFRRAQAPLQMSEGFHPKAKLTFPSALSLGIEAHDEVMEVELAEACEPRQLRQTLQRQSPTGLAILGVEPMAIGQPKARVARMWYEFPIPPECAGEVREAAEAFMRESSVLTQREGDGKSVDVRAAVDALDATGPRLRFCLRNASSAAARPRDILEALGLADWERQGLHLTRASVEIAS